MVQAHIPQRQQAVSITFTKYMYYFPYNLVNDIILFEMRVNQLAIYTS